MIIHILNKEDMSSNHRKYYKPSQAYLDHVARIKSQEQRIKDRIQLNEPRVINYTPYDEIIRAYPKVIEFAAKIMS